ncbi:carboxylesterase/lipase family protein [Actinoplanes solisilvae]|uniref:carboxylesterase/lipase family protein n=1 Tax=Actinoplanes solisilvae TaxID=2486853 RepID=UPI000FDA5781|nr:carboxylesterase family protein [Actinoplanes solisilvae]
MAEVRTGSGIVRGEDDAGVAVFRGIPFAEAPTGALRFGAPRPVPRWDGVRPATKYGPPPPQADQFDTTGDWLTVNVWSPDLGSARLPVMVWIHGGGYVFGASGSPEFDGRRLARDGGVVVVTFNYRVGFEGFGLIAGAPPNRGLLDQVAALEWVRDNIERFGGDPGRVTVFGESAGGGSVAALLAMPRAAGLFRRAVAQSVPGTFFSPELAADIATAHAAELGVPATEFATVDPALLVLASESITATITGRTARWGRAAYRKILFSPVVDGDVLPVTPWVALSGGAGRDIDLLVGHTRDEQRLFTAIDGLLGQISQEQAYEALAVLAPEAGYPEASPEELYELVHSDWLFRMPSQHLAESQALGGGRVHAYELTWPAPGMGGALGACHGLDVPLVFGNLDRGQPALLLGETPTPEAEKLSAEMRTAWTGFAADGNPGWPAYDTTRRLTRIFDTEAAVTPYPEEVSRRIWQDHTFPVLPLTPVEP